MPRERARNERIQGEALIQQQQVLIVVKFLSDKSPLYCKRQKARVRVPRLKSKSVARHMRNEQSFQNRIGREAPHNGIHELVSSGYRELACNKYLKIEFEPTLPCPPEILPLPDDQIRLHI